MNHYRLREALFAGIAILAVSGEARPTILRDDDLARTNAHATRAEEGGRWAMREGKLSNGLRYAVFPRSGTEPGFALYMRVSGGFYAEKRPGERGLVHLIEHIAFKGSSHLEPGAFQRIGQPITFPAPSAASTSWGNSSYYLTARDADRRSLDTLLMTFREIASELNFPAQGVREARTEVIKEMAEKRASNLTFANYIAAVAPGSPNDVIDAQNSADVPTASIATLRKLYRRLYRPERTELIVVGNVDPATTEALIRQHFASWYSVGNVGPDRPKPSYNRRSIRPWSYAADAAGRSVATVSLTMDLPPEGRTREQRLRDGMLDAAIAQLITARLRATQPSSPVGKVGATIENAEGYRLVRIWDFTDAGGWRPATINLRRQVCALRRGPWTNAEWEDAKSVTMAELRAKADRAGSRSNMEVAAELADADVDPQRMFDARDMAEYAKAALPAVSVGQAWTRWQQQWRRGVEHTRVETPTLAKSPSPAQDVADAITAAGGARCKI